MIGRRGKLNMSKALNEEMATFKQEVNEKVTDHFYKTTIQKHQALIAYIAINALVISLILAVFTFVWKDAGILKP